MKQSPSAESDTKTHSANQEVSPTVMGPKVYYCVWKRVLLVLNQRIKKSPACHQTWGSLMCSQGTVTFSSWIHSTVCQPITTWIYFGTILPSTPRFPKKSLLSRLPTQLFLHLLCLSWLLHSLHISAFLM